MHISRTLVEFVLRGELPRRLLDDIEHDHLECLCSGCAEGLKLLATGSPAEPGPRPEISPDPLEAIRRRLGLSVALYLLIGDFEKTAATFVKLGIVHHRLHHFDSAITSTEKALELLEREPSEWLRAYAHFNLALFLHSLGAVDQAEEELDRHLDLISAAGESLVFRAGWLRARIAWSREDLGKAEPLFRETYRMSVARGIPFDTGLVSLELALVHLGKGRTSQVKKLATEALGIFDEQEVDRECRAALDLLAAAARRDTITRKILEQVIAVLDKAHHAGRTPNGIPS